MSLPKRSLIERDHRIYEEIVAGELSFTAIAEKWGLSRKTISNIRERVALRLAPEFVSNIRRMKIDQSKALHHLIREAWRGYRESGSRRTSEEGSRDQESFEKNVVQEQSLDPKFLEIIRKSLNDIRGIWGVDAPKRVEADVDVTVTSDLGQHMDDINNRLEALLPRRIVAESPVLEASDDVAHGVPPASSSESGGQEASGSSAEEVATIDGAG